MSYSNGPRVAESTVCSRAEYVSVAALLASARSLVTSGWSSCVILAWRFAVFANQVTELQPGWIVAEVRGRCQDFAIHG